MLIIGSRALALAAPHLLDRTPRDFDIVGTEEEYSKFTNHETMRISDKKRVACMDRTIIEFEIALPGSSAEILLDLVKTPDVGFGKIAPLDLLYTIKKSHRFLKNSNFFWKTFRDYHTMKNSGARVRQEYLEFFRLREEETYNYKHPSLKQDKKNFFSEDQIKYIYDHDTIHEAVKIYDNPAYTYFQTDGAEVECDKEKFFKLPLAIQRAAVKEEASVLALERSLIPHPGVLTPAQAWKMAYSKVASSITSGWFREFAYEDGLEIIKYWPSDYFERFKQGVANKTVKLA